MSERYYWSLNRRGCHLFHSKWLILLWIGVILLRRSESIILTTLFVISDISFLLHQLPARKASGDRLFQIYLTVHTETWHVVCQGKQCHKTDVSHFKTTFLREDLLAAAANCSVFMGLLKVAGWSNVRRPFNLLGRWGFFKKAVMLCGLHLHLAEIQVNVV